MQMLILLKVTRHCRSHPTKMNVIRIFKHQTAKSSSAQLFCPVIIDLFNKNLSSSAKLFFIFCRITQKQGFYLSPKSCSLFMHFSDILFLTMFDLNMYSQAQTYMRFTTPPSTCSNESVTKLVTAPIH